MANSPAARLGRLRTARLIACGARKLRRSPCDRLVREIPQHRKKAGFSGEGRSALQREERRCCVRFTAAHDVEALQEATGATLDRFNPTGRAGHLSHHNYAQPGR